MALIRKEILRNIIKHLSALRGIPVIPRAMLCNSTKMFHVGHGTIQITFKRMFLFQTIQRQEKPDLKQDLHKNIARKMRQPAAQRLSALIGRVLILHLNHALNMEYSSGKPLCTSIKIMMPDSFLHFLSWEKAMSTKIPPGTKLMWVSELAQQTHYISPQPISTQTSK